VNHPNNINETKISRKLEIIKTKRERGFKQQFISKAKTSNNTVITSEGENRQAYIIVGIKSIVCECENIIGHEIRLH